MYVDSSSITVNHKTYTRHLLRTSFRKDGKVKHRTIANISSCSDEEIQAVKLGLKYKGNLRAPLLGSPIVGTDYESWVWRLAVC